AGRRGGLQVASAVVEEAVDPLVERRATDPLRAGDRRGPLAGVQGQQGVEAAELVGGAGRAGEASQLGPLPRVEGQDGHADLLLGDQLTASGPTCLLSSDDLLNAVCGLRGQEPGDLKRWTTSLDVEPGRHRVAEHLAEQAVAEVPLVAGPGPLRPIP